MIDAGTGRLMTGLGQRPVIRSNLFGYCYGSALACVFASHHAGQTGRLLLLGGGAKDLRAETMSFLRDVLRLCDNGDTEPLSTSV